MTASVLAPDGLVRPVLFGKPVGALDAAGVCAYFGRSPKNSTETIAQLRKQPGFPAAIKPWGAKGQERWNIEELDEWRLTQCPRSTAETARRWSADDPRRARVKARAAAREGSTARTAEGIGGVQ